MIIKTKAETGKQIAPIIEDVLGARAKYMGPPSFAYEVGGVVVQRDGNVNADTHIEEITERLGAEKLLVDEDSLEIKVPIKDMDARQLTNLLNILFSRQKMLNHSIGVDNFYVDESLVSYLKEDKPDSVEAVKGNSARFEMTKGFHFTEDEVVFTGFPVNGDYKCATAYCSLVAMIVDQARKSRRTTTKIVESENEKYAARIWLNQLGLTGRGGKEIRQVFLRNLEGNSAFRTEESKARWNENRRNK